MKVAVFGVGYVGLVTGTCLAEVGNDVFCVDVDADKIAGLQRGIIPIHEPGLEEMVARNSELSRLQFTTDPASALDGAQVAFIAVGTPPDEDGSADLQYVLQVAATIGEQARGPIVVVNKSTVPVGTADLVQETLLAASRQRGHAFDMPVISNPEFLKEGAAIDDCMRPDRIVLGSASQSAVETMKTLYAPFNRVQDRIIVMDVRSAELTKYAANAMLATKISFMNEMSNIAERVGADIEMVRHGIGSDTRIGYRFIYAGAGYGGSCFPKDVRALEHVAVDHGYQPRILNAVQAVNDDQKEKLFDLLSTFYDGKLAGKRLAIWGLAFKPRTDDMREAPSRVLLQALWRAGATAAVYDPAAMQEARRIFGQRDDLTFCASPEAALEGADALILVTEWQEFWSPDFAQLKKALRDKVIFDGRNIYRPASVEQAGLAYYGIGTGRSVSRHTPS
ncbi:UDP-glucose/GDP-mannose dehydrogenase family protein [Achromobacter denitrificans]|uniref:UDP-glucose dehydrogenase family protein n=1 Tax=Achromobacter denitrificans TaxID=32002 RepID=UPI00240DAA95|nr:UDP-glucose/GDP-mannose dehydrogenase family protein [Achromobacter denitrificans]WFC69587.1 UDP-glucose/GDP-mannose dehydrogenase family protein [Achromobacter denitrificans]